MRHALLRRRTRPYQPILRLKKHADAFRQIFRDQGRNTDAEIDKHPRLKLTGDAAHNYSLRFHGASHGLVMRWSTIGAGVMMWSGEITPTGTMLSAQAMTVSAAMAMTGLKFRAVSA